MSKKSIEGHSLLVVLLLTLVLGYASVHLLETQGLRHQLQTQQQARQGQILGHIKLGLLGHAANQGIHSQSHLGHLPCPAIQAGEHAQTACLNRPWGYLPVLSKTAVNYLNPGIDARNNELEPAARKHWQYAVSAQLVQPNALGWGRWVDYSQPALQIRIPTQDNRIEHSLAAVVAHTVQATGTHSYDITPPYMVIRVDELQQHMARVQRHHFNTTLHHWLALNPTASSTLPHENLQTLTNQAGVFQAVDSQCSCRCTRTRCQCACNGHGMWQSGQQECASTPETPCLLFGPTSLKSQWPISRFEPVAASNKSCRPTARHVCPLSKDNNPCTCDFSWPDSTKSNLSQLTFTLPQTP